MRALFLGSPCVFTARTLWSWIEAGNTVSEFWWAQTVSKVAWRRDRNLGRLQPHWSVSAALKHHGIRVRRVPPLKTCSTLQRLACQLDARLLLSCMFSYVVPDKVLHYFGHRAVNLHPALLPRYRGPCPIIWMLYNEEVNTFGGVTLHVMSSELDQGDIIAQIQVPWRDGAWFRKWEAQLSLAAGDMIRDHLVRYLKGEIAGSVQVGPSSYHRGMDLKRLTITGNLSADRIRHLLQTIGGFRPLCVPSKRGLVKVCRFARIVGPPSGRGTRVGLRSITLDASDARVRLHRWMPWTSKCLKAQALVAYATTPAEIRRAA